MCVLPHLPIMRSASWVSLCKTNKYTVMPLRHFYSQHRLVSTTEHVCQPLHSVQRQAGTESTGTEVICYFRSKLATERRSEADFSLTEIPSVTRQISFDNSSTAELTLLYQILPTITSLI